MTKDKRFETTKPDGTMSGPIIIVDKETGVNYLFFASGYAGGLTPLLDRDGAPIITPRLNK